MSSHSDRLGATFLKNSPGAPIIVISIYYPTSAPPSDNEQGWGRLSLLNVLAPISASKVFFVDASIGLNLGEKDDYVIRITDISVPLKVTMVTPTILA